MRRAFETAAIVVLVAIVCLCLQNVALGAYFPRLERLTTDFSPAYLQRELNRLAAGPRPVIFLGDSVVWGYRLQARETAVALLAAQGCACRNLAFKSGSPPNYYALARLMRDANVRPAAVVIEVNPKVFGEADPAYQKLHPALAQLAGPLLSPADRAAVVLPPAPQGVAAALDRTVAPASLLYAMRSDIRETLYGDPDDAAPSQPATSEMFQASYDLTPLTPSNAGVHFLAKTVDELRAGGSAVIAFMTPTNHALLHEFIDNADYRSNGLYLRQLLARHGARVVDLDAAFPASEFIDNDHLTAAGQARLAAALAP